MKEITLPSGAILRVGTIPFDPANNFKKAILRELKHVPISSTTQIIEICKNYLCSGFGSDELETLLWECMKKCTYNKGKGDFKIEKSTFEDIEARADYTDVQMEVARETLSPFSKGLFAALSLVISQANVSIPQ